MNFPAYVPAAVREKITHYLEGESDRSIPGYIALLANVESELANIEQAIKARIARGEVEYLPSLHKQKAEATQRRDHLSGDVDYLQRLAHDSRMRDAFALLTQEFTDDEQWRRFIFSSRAARVDYGPYRDKLKGAGELKDEIADAAANLAKLLKSFSNIGVEGPLEFYSIPQLLRKTDNDAMDTGNLHMWRALRGRLLGDLLRSDTPEGKEAGPGTRAPNGRSADDCCWFRATRRQGRD